MRGPLLLVLLAALIFGGIVWEIASWQECLDGNSWWYCLRVLSK
jgi:hypothetical protein